jgi:hypothetical protein
MDFTRNAWPALWFACHGEPGCYGLLVGMDLANAFEGRDSRTLAVAMATSLDEAGDRLSTRRPSARGRGRRLEARSARRGYCELQSGSNSETPGVEVIAVGTPLPSAFAT